MSSAVVVIPVYKDGLSDDERASLSCCFSVLGNHPIVFVVPEGLDIRSIVAEFQPSGIETFSRDYFSSKVSYNALMLSPQFYERFLAWDYMLLYQLDAWVFRDELMSWVDRGYDYIGAPWLNRWLYRNMVYKLCSALKTKMMSAEKTVDNRHAGRGRVGNGGFSLRRNRTIYELLSHHPERVHYYIRRSAFHRYYEDVFFAVEAQRLDPGFKIPSLEEALSFAFDTYPHLAYKRSGGKLPFGCHGFNKRKSKAFWKRIVPGMKPDL